MQPPNSRGASGGSLRGGASFKVEKAHFAAWKKGPENRKNEVKLPPSVSPHEALYDECWALFCNKLVFFKGTAHLDPLLSASFGT